MNALTRCRVDYRSSKLVYNIYKNSELTVNLHAASKRIKLGTEVRKGDNTSPKFVITVLEHTSKKLN